MTEYYIIIIGILIVFALTDLIVGVSNDAVNFLNSAVGSRAATRRTILIVATIGIMIGATFSSGMMEVARKGLFYPQAFVFSDVMIIFLAVMITDIFLLDLFNTFGLPTSTTVSLIFEILGAAVVVALLKMSATGEALNHLSNYINSASALAIITTILASVAVSFFLGSIIQYLSRLIFTFQYEKRFKWIGGMWSGLALTFLTHFLLFKGIKGASFVSAFFIEWVSANMVQLMLFSFIGWSILMQVLIMLKIKVLRLVVLFGTFSLAMAFAGNDLVNFIGVPLAGLESFFIWKKSAVDASQLTMDALNEPVRANTVFLLLAGIVMAITLWLSKKARTVTETEVSLGRQDEGMENFSSNALSRSIVRLTRRIGKALERVVPRSFQNWSEKSFTVQHDSYEKDKPAFDLIRASVNLTVASTLIAFATSLKLPLSTTYVTFMVAMATSFSDRAWGRDTAVYRVAGVLNVIGGWFVTAIIAFSVSGLNAFLVYKFGGWAVAFLVSLLAYFVYKSHIFHKVRKQEKEVLVEFEQQSASIPGVNLIEETSEKLANALELINSTYKNALSGLLEENMDLINEAKRDLTEAKRENDKLKKRLFRAIQRLEEKETEASMLYLRMYDLQLDIIDSTGMVVKTCLEHVSNSLKPLKPEQISSISSVILDFEEYLQYIVQTMREKEFMNLKTIVDKKKALLDRLETMLSEQIAGIKRGDYGKRNSSLIFTIKLETKDIIAVAARFVKLYHKALNDSK
jgi:phosphate/sulfate permease